MLDWLATLAEVAVEVAAVAVAIVGVSMAAGVTVVDALGDLAGMLVVDLVPKIGSSSSMDLRRLALGLGLSHA